MRIASSSAVERGGALVNAGEFGDAAAGTEDDWRQLVDDGRTACEHAGVRSRSADDAVGRVALRPAHRSSRSAVTRPTESSTPTSCAATGSSASRTRPSPTCWQSTSPSPSVACAPASKSASPSTSWPSPSTPSATASSRATPRASSSRSTPPPTRMLHLPARGAAGRAARLSLRSWPRSGRCSPSVLASMARSCAWPTRQLRRHGTPHLGQRRGGPRVRRDARRARSRAEDRAAPVGHASALRLPRHHRQELQPARAPSPWRVGPPPSTRTSSSTARAGRARRSSRRPSTRAGPRASEPFIGVNCAAVPRELLEAELFGYEKGAFTGARSEGNPGKFELAAGGTILLDEIGDMPLDMQAKLLRVLQERVVTRLGGRSELHVHARVIATTHRDLAQLVDEGKFRMDLFYRLRVLAIELPPLRDRQDDIPVLAQHFLHALRRAAAQARARARPARARRAGALRLAGQRSRARQRHGGRGEPRSAGRRRARPAGDAPRRTLPHGGERGLDGRVARGGDVSRGSSSRSSRSPRSRSARSCTAIERCGGSVSKAAEALGVSKVTVYAKLRSWGMHPKDRLGETGEHGDGPASARWTMGRMPVVEEAAPVSSPAPETPASDLAEAARPARGQVSRRAGAGSQEARSREPVQLPNEVQIVNVQCPNWTRNFSRIRGDFAWTAPCSESTGPGGTTP